MDVGYYISELLGQHGDINVPGLGYFAHTRVTGYYNERDAKFYPPGYTVQYDPQFIEDDDTLAVYMADKKKISLASSKYFTEKFVTTLKQQAAIGEAALADLGWFSIKDAQLLFRPNTNTSTDPEFFGLPVIKIHKKGKQPLMPQEEPVEETAAPVAYNAPAEQELSEQQFRTAQEQEDYLMELTAKKRRKNTWVFILLTLIFTALIIFLVKRYDPSLFNFSLDTKPAVTKEPTIIMQPADTAAKTKPVAKADTDTIAKAKPAITDTVTKNTAPVNDSIPLPRWEIMGGTFKTEKSANLAIKNYKSLGIEARIAYAPGPRVHVTLGTYKTRAEAAAAIKELKKTKKVKQDIYPLEIKAKL